MPRIDPILPALAVWTGLLLVMGAASAAGQGISGVTRRTPTLEKQAVARGFFDAAGIATAGAGVGARQAGPRGLPLAAAPSAPASPALAPPALATRVNLPPVHQRPFLVPARPMPALSRITNRPPTQPSHAAPRLPSRTP